MTVFRIVIKHFKSFLIAVWNNRSNLTDDVVHQILVEDL